jgi:hypothetical protein
MPATGSIKGLACVRARAQGKTCTICRLVLLGEFTTHTHTHRSVLYTKVNARVLNTILFAVGTWMASPMMMRTASATSRSLFAAVRLVRMRTRAG